MTEHPEKTVTKSIEALYAPSWIDHITAWIDHFQGSAWTIYLLSVLTLVFLVNAVFWIDGSIKIGSIKLDATIFAFFVIYWVWLYRYLCVVGSHSLQKFRPLLEVDNSEIERINYHLTILPRWIGLLSIPIGFGLAVSMVLSDPAPYGDIIPRTILPYVADIVISGFMLSTFLCLIIRSVRQLYLVRKLNAQATNINILKLEPAHAFSALTSRTGIGMILVVILSLPLDPTPLASSLDIALAAITFLLSIAVFVFPIIGIRHHLENEKQRVLNQTNDLLQITIDRLHAHIQGNDNEHLDRIKNALDALIRERELIGKTSTWPWDLSTLRTFSSALLLPIILWLVTRLLENFISF